MKEKYIPNTRNQYIVRSDGEIISLKYNKRRILSHRYSPKGYRVCTIKINNSFITKTVHRIVAEAFIPNLENKEFVNHIDGDKNNPDIDNLEWVTREENIQHSKEILGNNFLGEDSKQSKLTEEQARFVKYEARNFSNKRLAKLFNCSNANISHIRNNKHWSWL